MRIFDVNEFSQHCDAKGYEEQIGFTGIKSAKAADFQILNEDPLNAVCVFTRAKVEDWRISFLINVYLQSFLHFQIAPAVPFSQVIN